MITNDGQIQGVDRFRFWQMTHEKIIECLGASDEDVAHLRLLLRTSATQLNAAWQWGSEDHADLVIVDSATLVGAAARTRMLARGVPWAELIAAPAPPPDGLFLRKPIHREAFVDLLNGSGRRTIAPFTVLSQGDDFFMVDLAEFDDDSGEDAPDIADIHEPERPAPAELDEFEALFKRDPLANTAQILLPEQLQPRTGVEYTGERTDRSRSNANERKPFINDALLPEHFDPWVRGAADAPGEDAHPLADFLAGKMLGGPSRLALPGLPTLVLDPKRQLYHAQGELPELEEYCRRPLQRSDWHVLLSQEWLDVHEHIPAKPYHRLRWLDRMISSNGYLAKHLDPGGTYRLTRALELETEYPRAHRIGVEMQVPLRLHEIVARSGTSMAEVFAVVTAYDAIGWVEWQARESLRSPSRPER